MSEGKAIYAALQAVQRELKAPKSQYNSFGKYNYRSPGAPIKHHVETFAFNPLGKETECRDLGALP